MIAVARSPWKKNRLSVTMFTMKKAPLVSVLVHTRNSQKTIKKHLESIKNQTYKNIEIIMVDNNSNDNTVHLARKIINSIYRYGPERSAQRNFAAKKARGQYYFVPDSDMIIGKNVIKECIDLIKTNPGMKAVVIPEKSLYNGFWSKCKALERECYLGDETIEAARFFEKNAFWEMGGYDENLTGPEDWDLPQKIRSKYEIGRVKSKILHDDSNLSLAALAQKKHYYGLKVALYIRKNPIQSTLQQLVYLLRPAFYRNWRLLTKHPMLTIGMVIMLTVEQVAGFVGFLQGGIKGEKN